MSAAVGFVAAQGRKARTIYIHMNIYLRALSSNKYKQTMCLSKLFTMAVVLAVMARISLGCLRPAPEQRATSNRQC